MGLLATWFRRLVQPGAIALLVLIVVGIALTWLVRAQREDDVSISHSTAVREAMGQVRLALFEAETGMRGYLITGRDDYLQPFIDAKNQLPTRVERIGQLTRDNQRQQENVAKLAPMIDRMLVILQGSIDIYRQSGRDAAFAAITGESKTLADQANSIVDMMFAEENRLLAVRQATMDRTTLSIQLLTVLALLAAIAASSFAAIEGAKRRKEIEAGHAALQDSHDRLRTEVRERESVELQLRQAQKMEAVGQLTGGVAHDFNNMLAVIIGALDIARKRLNKGNGDIATFIDSAIEGAKRGATLTQRLLAFSRQQALDPKVLGVNTLISGLSDFLRRSLGENIQIEIVHGAGLWRVHVDGHQLENAIINLAVNARDAMPKGGRLTIETENTKLDARYAAESSIAPGDYIMVCVTDTGAGMTPETMARAFDPFFTTKAVGQGTGLGLSQVFGFVKQSGGHIKIYSEVDRGTTVKVYLPRHDGADGLASEYVAAAPQDVTDGHEPAVVLVVEDDDTVRLLTTASVEELGYTVLSANSAKEALKILANRADVKLLLTDVVMPEITGRQLAEEALKNQPQLKVLFTTGYTRNAIVHNGTLDAGVHLLSKPFTLDQLSVAIRRVVAG